MADSWQCNKEGSLEQTSKVAAELGLSFPAIHFSAEQMARLAIRMRRRNGGVYCELPFCQTVEAEALGAHIAMGDWRIGPRADKPSLERLQDVLSLKPANFQTGRAAEVLKACALVAEAGEDVALAVSGPVTLANAMLDVSLLLKAFRKDPDLAFEVMEFLGEQSLRYVEIARAQDVRAIRYADPLVAPDIVGSKIGGMIAERSTASFLRRMRIVLGSDVHILVCPKTCALLPSDEEWEEACRWATP